MKTYIAYTRVSTTRQTLGASLFEQRASIERYALDRDLTIIAWHEEVQAAAKRGRYVFNTIIKELDRGHADGLILHKVDRGVRTLRDWATLGELIDRGVDVRFACDDLDMETRGGRLTADIQAVIAADYIRNLREEVRKGIRGRVSQGLYPLPAPVGYQNRGGGHAKVPDPVTASLVLFAFQAYATGSCTLRALVEQMRVRGLDLTPTSLSSMLRRSFYVGVVRIRGLEQQGLHQPIVSQDLFDQVQTVLRQRRHPKRTRHTFRYNHMLACGGCTRKLTGEIQRGHTYYRCHTCRGVSVREDRIDPFEATISVGNIIVYQRFPHPAKLTAFQMFEPAITL